MPDDNDYAIFGRFAVKAIQGLMQDADRLGIVIDIDTNSAIAQAIRSSDRITQLFIEAHNQTGKD
jgi:hypothetical protein